MDGAPLSRRGEPQDEANTPNREWSVKKCEPTKVPACGGRLCLPDSRGAGAGRLPALLGLPSGRTKWPLTWP